jgi:CheY-like chemotaxis protein
MEAETFLGEYPECAVVVSDLRMPEMDGLALLERARVLAPDEVRIMLTGYADVHAAIDAINRASIFRLLTKPCGGAALCSAVRDAIRQHQLVIAERELLEQTLRGSVQVLVEILSLVDPVGSSQALRIHRYVRHIIDSLALDNGWALEVAAMLSHLGALTLASADGAFPDSPQSHPSVGYQLLKNIPRLDAVAAIIARQQQPIDPGEAKVAVCDRDPARRGGQVLRVAIEFDTGISGGLTRNVVLLRMQQRPGDFDRAVVDSLQNVELPERTFESRSESMADLRVGMILDEDLRNPLGMLIVTRGQEITRPVLLRLSHFGSPKELRDTRVQVLAPAAHLLGSSAPT